MSVGEDAGEGVGEDEALQFVSHVPSEHACKVKPLLLLLQQGKVFPPDLSEIFPPSATHTHSSSLAQAPGELGEFMLDEQGLPGLLQVVGGITHLPSLQVSGEVQSGSPMHSTLYAL